MRKLQFSADIRRIEGQHMCRGTQIFFDFVGLQFSWIFHFNDNDNFPQKSISRVNISHIKILLTVTFEKNLEFQKEQQQKKDECPETLV